MRKLLIIALGSVALGIAVAPVPAAAEPQPAPTVIGWAGGITHAVEGQVPADEELGPPSGDTRRIAQPARYYATVPVLVTRPDGTRCMRDVRRSFTDPLAAEAAANTRQAYLWQVTLGGWLPCQDPDAPAAGPSPGQRASDYWRVAGEDLLPKPSPRIAPGYMLAGKLAYLESGSQATTRFEHATPIGTLVIEATSQLMVDWGDGSGLTGPHAGPGAPWPSGTITHFWTTAATYDVRVVQRWAGRWNLGGEAGALDGLETEAVIDDFEVRQLQAVRNW